LEIYWRDAKRQVTCLAKRITEAFPKVPVQ